MNEDDLSRQFKALLDEWLEAVTNKRFAWIAQHIADDFLGTAQPWPSLSVNKQKMLEAGKTVEKMDIHWVEVRAREFGDMVLTTGVRQYEKEQFSAAATFGGNMPTPNDLARHVNGKRVLYIDAWRRNGEIWQLFDHHMVSIVGDAQPLK
jgi:ketosteroid isomerase-like protein